VHSLALNGFIMSRCCDCSKLFKFLYKNKVIEAQETKFFSKQINVFVPDKKDVDNK
jgi:hypothetical protein